MVRTQIQFPEDELRELKREAAEEGISVSEAVRRYVAAGRKAKRRPTRQELMKRALEVAGKFNSGIPDLAERHDEYFVESILDDSLR
ncbi:MAG: ribbon-helix-helix protein, CopG family [Armatimonadota bacterium]